MIRENIIYHEDTNKPVIETVEEFYENGQLTESGIYKNGILQ